MERLLIWSVKNNKKKNPKSLNNKNGTILLHKKCKTTPSYMLTSVCECMENSGEILPDSRLGRGQK